MCLTWRRLSLRTADFSILPELERLLQDSAFTGSARATCVGTVSDADDTPVENLKNFDFVLDWSSLIPFDQAFDPNISETIIADGGQGVISSLCRGIHGDRIVVKRVKSWAALDHLQQLAAAARLYYEFSITRTLVGPGIAASEGYYCGATPNDSPVFAMQYVEGRTLGELLHILRRHFENDRDAGRFDLLILIPWFVRLARTVARAHAKGILHGDLSPSQIAFNCGASEFNLQRIFNSDLYIYDWGLALPPHTQVACTVSNFPGIRGSETVPLVSQDQFAGTPGYMSPEHAMGKMHLDQRSEVFCLGILLYEFLTGVNPFAPTRREQQAIARGNLRPYKQRIENMATPVPPSCACNRLPIFDGVGDFDEVVQICLHRDPGQRFADATQLLDSLSTVLDGRKQYEDTGRAIADLRRSELPRLREAQVRVKSAQQEYRNLCKQLDADADSRAKLPLWNIKRELSTALTELDEKRQTLLHIVAALLKIEHPDGRALILEILLEQLDEALAGNDGYRIGVIDRQVKLWDVEKRFASRLDPQGALTLSTPADAVVTFHAIEEEAGRLLPRSGTPLPPGSHRFLAGSYLLIVERPGYVTLRIPILIRRGETLSINPNFYTSSQVPNGFCIISGGPYWGTDPQSGEHHAWTLPDYAIEMFPTTNREYFEFLNQLPNPYTDAQPYLPFPRQEPPEWDGNAWIPPHWDKDPTKDRWDLEWPATGVNVAGVKAFFQWKCRKLGIPHGRLPTWRELEKAGRGVDGRPYPWGTQDASDFAEAGKSVKIPLPVGENPIDCSPYEVRDLAGGVRELAQPSIDRSTDSGNGAQHKLMLVFGGSVFNPRGLCNLATAPRGTIQADDRHNIVGFRMVIPLSGEPSAPVAQD